MKPTKTAETTEFPVQNEEGLARFQTEELAYRDEIARGGKPLDVQASLELVQNEIIRLHLETLSRSTEHSLDLEDLLDNERYLHDLYFEEEIEVGEKAFEELQKELKKMTHPDANLDAILKKPLAYTENLPPIEIKDSWFEWEKLLEPKWTSKSSPSTLFKPSVPPLQPSQTSTEKGLPSLPPLVPNTSSAVRTSLLKSAKPSKNINYGRGVTIDISRDSDEDGPLRPKADTFRPPAPPSSRPQQFQNTNPNPNPTFNSISSSSARLPNGSNQNRGGFDDPMDVVEEKRNPFVTGLEKLKDDDAKQGRVTKLSSSNNNNANNNNGGNNNGPQGRTIGVKRVFSAPFAGQNDGGGDGGARKKQRKNDDEGEGEKEFTYDQPDHPLYKNLEPVMLERIHNEILDRQLTVHWDDIAGLEDVKGTLNEMIILPHKRPDLFRGLRQPPKGLLLFGPPGNGKTMIAKAVATEARLTFFSISASSLTSKWIGEGEKMVKCLFAVARVQQPSFIFIDEIDSILSVRGDNENEATRRLKTEFLLQFDGATSGSEEDRITVMGATNRPQDIAKFDLLIPQSDFSHLDEAARRRLSKRIYVPLPESAARKRLVKILLKGENHALDEAKFDELAQLTDNYSGNDLANLCKDAAMAPLREMMMERAADIEQLPTTFRPLNLDDFKRSLKKIKPSVSVAECKHYEEWNKMFGSSGL